MLLATLPLVVAAAAAAAKQPCPPGTVEPDCHPVFHPRGHFPSKNESLNPTRMINVKTDFNATGDGSTDDFANIAAAIQARIHTHCHLLPPQPVLVHI